MQRRFFIKGSISAIALTTLGMNIFTACDDKNFPFKKNQKIGCIGDSVTLAGGKGYVELLQDYFNTMYPEYQLQFLNLGQNSETITGLTEKEYLGSRPYLFDRLEKILDDNDLDMAFFCYGINCGIYSEPSPDTFARYKAGVLRFLDMAKIWNIDVVLLTPPPMALSDSSKKELAANQITEYSWKNPYPEYDVEVVQEFKKIILQTDHPAIHSKINIHTPLLENSGQAYSSDPIHPNNLGNQIIADVIKTALL